MSQSSMFVEKTPKKTDFSTFQKLMIIILATFLFIEGKITTDIQVIFYPFILDTGNLMSVSESIYHQPLRHYSRVGLSRFTLFGPKPVSNSIFSGSSVWNVPVFVLFNSMRLCGSDKDSRSCVSRQENFSTQRKFKKKKYYYFCLIL